MAAAPQHLPIFARFGRNVMEVREQDDTKAAEAGVAALEAFYRTIRMPSNLREAGVREEDLDRMAGKAVEDGDLGVLSPIGRDEALRILRAAF